MDRLSLTLPAPLLTLVRVLGAEAGDTRIVGGAVRDSLAGLAIHDIDLATRLLPEEVARRAEAAGFKPVPTGIAHGTVTVVAEGRPFEVTTLRRDVSTDGRHATIAFSDDWREDASRRDFTINALYADPLTGEIFDWFGGRADLAAGLVRFIGDPLTRIAEDHLRILRFYRFQARFGRGAPDSEALAACTARANDLMALSRERIADELLRLLALADPTATVALMQAQGIFLPVLPEVDGNSIARLSQLVAAEASAGLPPVGLHRLSALLPADPALADTVAARLKLSKAARKFLAAAAARVPEDADDPRALAYWQGADVAQVRVLLAGGDVSSLQHWDVPAFPLTGRAIIKRGISAGPEVARLLKLVEKHWVEQGFPDANAAEALADEVVRG